jgi:hypothetical protein
LEGEEEEEEEAEGEVAALAALAAALAAAALAAVSSSSRCSLMMVAAASLRLPQPAAASRALTSRALQATPVEWGRCPTGMRLSSLSTWSSCTSAAKGALELPPSQASRVTSKLASSELRSAALVEGDSRPGEARPAAPAAAELPPPPPPPERLRSPAFLASQRPARAALSLMSLAVCSSQSQALGREAL